MFDQLPLFEVQPEAEDSYFHAMLTSLDVGSEAGWPDRFGQSLREWFLSHPIPPIRTLSLFSGGGGLDIGFADAGFHSVQMIEIEQKYVETLQANAKPGRSFEGSEPLCVDIQDYAPAPDMQIDFVIGGPPCQSFSAAGRRASGVPGINDPRGGLFAEYIRIIHHVRPKGFLFENVYGLTGAQGGEAWTEMKQQFQQLGYILAHRVIDAADYGVPQHRERFVIVGLLDKEFQFPEPTHGPDSRHNLPYYTAGEALVGVSTDVVARSLSGQYGHLLAAIPPGLNYSFYTEKMGHPEPIFGWRSKFSDFLYKADPDAPVRTIKAQGGQYTGPFSWENRPFSLAEYKRLQTFPDTYSIVGGRQKCIEQIGNSVPPQLARMLALSVLQQAFGMTLPFKLNYLTKERQLSFRQRKRRMTNIYQSRAHKAIAEMDTQPSRVYMMGHRETQRWMNPSFLWAKHSIKHGIEVNLSLQNSQREWTITANAADGKERTAFHIEVSAARGEKWQIPVERVILRGSATPASFTAAWKFFEEIVLESSGVADLVQLSNYYQYKPRLQAKMRLEHMQDESNEALWEGIQSLVNGRCIAKQLPEESLAELLDIQADAILPLLLFARKLGYEVRNQYTNPQIPVGEYLIPYLFPTLTSRSVQLHKSLEAL